VDWYSYPPGYGYGGDPGYGHGYPYQPRSASAGQLDTSDATAAESTGIVEISTTIEYDEGEAAGTGLVLGSDGLVVTNHHVVEGATSITVTVPSTGQQYHAEVLGYDARRDVAVLQLEDASGLATVRTDTAGVSAGDTVTAVGDAGGDGGSLTAAPGQVTGTGRTITVQDDLTGQHRRLARLIEATSDVVPGDSGGALLDADGQVVGMNVAASSGSTSETVDGYAIPISRVLRVVDRVQAGDESGSVVVGGTPFLGVQLSDGSAALAGVVDGSPAAGLGLAAGDTVTSLGGTAVRTADQLRAAVAAHRPGDPVTVTWTDSSGGAHTGTATLVSGPVG
jgi:S1-C subfamily serine protease